MDDVYIDVDGWLREQQRREAEVRRLFDLFHKVERQGHQSLTDEERRFLKDFADRCVKGR